MVIFFVTSTSGPLADMHCPSYAACYPPKQNSVFVASVVDPHHFDADSEADPDSTHHPYAVRTRIRILIFI
jgi:hypothetical protein